MILMYIELVAATVAFTFVMRYHLHMLQLNGYKNNEYFAWLKKRFRPDAPVILMIIGLILGVCAIACGIVRKILSMEEGEFFFYIFDAVLILWAIVIIPVFIDLIRGNTKKRFVYTARVKRLIVVDYCLSILIELLIHLLTRDRFICIGCCVILAAAQFVFPAFINFMNRPMEATIRNHYINDAKRMLRESPDLTVIGVTGSYGKTSVKFYLGALLAEEYSVLVTPESYNTPMGVVKTIREKLKSTHQIFICEMGARYVGDIKELCDIVHPDAGVITAVGPQHLETFGDTEHVLDTKFELADSLKPGSKLFLNADNDYILTKLDKYEDIAILYHTCEMDVGYRAKDIVVSDEGTEFTVENDAGGRERFSMQLVGAHNVINVLGAIAVANSFGISLNRLKVPVRRLTPVKHRMELITRGDLTIIDDAYNSNPVGSKAAVETLAMFDGLHILITPGMVELGDKEAEYNRVFGGYAAACCDYILLVGEEHTRPIRDGALRAGFAEKKCLVFEKLEEALTFAYSIATAKRKYILLENDLPDQYS